MSERIYDEAAPRPAVTGQPAAADEFDRGWIRDHIAEERRMAGLLGEVREAIFGAQDGLISTLAVVSAVAAALPERFAILVAGIASALAGVFSMAAGEYIGSKSQQEIFDAQIHGERQEVHDRPGEAEAEVAFMLEEDGLSRDEAVRVAGTLARHPEALLKTMIQKELGLAPSDHAGTPLQGAVVMGAAFGVGAAVPVIPYVLLPVQTATYASVVATALVLFGVGVIKTRWTRRSPLTSGLEILTFGAFAGVAGYFFGSILPSLLGAPAVGS